MLDFDLSDFRTSRRFRLPEDVSRNSEALTLRWSEVPRDQGMRGAAKVINAVRSILPDINFSIWIGDAIDDAHERKSD